MSQRDPIGCLLSALVNLLALFALASAILFCLEGRGYLPPPAYLRTQEGPTP